MVGRGLKNEVAGLRGNRLLKRAKSGISRFIGRAHSYDVLAAGVEFALSRHQERERPLVYYEFGTGAGSTLQRALAVLRTYPDAHVVLFDSFAGLPAPQGKSDAHVTWKEGAFAFPEDYIRNIVQRCDFPLDRVRFVKGFFEDSLTPELRQELAAMPPAFVTVDLDYYSSTRIALRWLAPLLSSGATFYFDDVWSFDGHPDYGQLRAIREFCEEYKEEGALVQNPLFGGQLYSYYRRQYEFADS